MRISRSFSMLLAGVLASAASSPASACSIAAFTDPLPGGGGETMFAIGLAGSRLYGGWIGPPRITVETPAGTFPDCTMWLPPLRIEPDGRIWSGVMVFYYHNTTEILRIGFTNGRVDSQGFGAGPQTGGTVQYLFSPGGVQAPPELSVPIQGGSFYFEFHNPIQGPGGPEYTASFRTWAPLPRDINGDDAIDLTDLAILLAHFGTTGGATPAEGDLNGDHAVDLADLSLLLSVFGASCV